jgi:F-type H+-transporting ATPase subunit epsilon
VAEDFEIEIATPQRLLAREKAIRAQIPALDGYIGVLPDHAPLLS